MKHHIQRLQVVPGKVAFFLGKLDIKQVRKTLRKQNLWSGEGRIDPPSGDSRGCCWDMGQNQAVWVRRYHPRDPLLAGVLAHEILHAVISRAVCLNFVCSEDSVEHYCYEMEFLTGSFVNAFGGKEPGP